MKRRTLLSLFLALGIASVLALAPADAQREGQPAETPAGQPASPAAGQPASPKAGPKTESTAKKSDGHSDSFIAGRDCNDCHTTDGWALSSTAGSRGGFDHASTGFPLTGTHATVPCTGCHRAERKTERDCNGCHRDEHKGRLGQQCDQCHDSRTWRNTRAIERHRMTRLPLTGMHALIDCNACHIRTTERTWDALPADCFACHEKNYRGAIHPAHTGPAPYPRDCSLCHRPSGWSPAVISAPSVAAVAANQRALSDHDVRFPISFGKHRGAPCESCHITPALPRAVACTGCHVHSLDQLRRQHAGKVVATDGAGCLRCHPGGAAR